MKMDLYKKLCLMIMALFVSIAGQAQTENAFFLPAKTDVFELYSKEIDETYRIQVVMPIRKEDESESFPVLYMTDVNGGFDLAHITTTMQMTGDIPRVILVGIGYKRGASTIPLRMRDMTQVKSDAAIAQSTLPIKGVNYPKERSGKAPQFLDFILNKVKPFVDRNYPTLKDDNGLWGDSLGGLFTLYAMLEKPEAFQRYIIGSPSIWFANEEIMTRAEKFVAEKNDLNANVFLGIGELEEEGPAAAFKMVTNVKRLDKLLSDRKFPSLNLTTRVFEDETHVSVVLMNYIRGLRVVYDKPEKSFLAP